jgi:peptidoglycan/LPS O-acetylase OafA/YrhL
VVLLGGALSVLMAQLSWMTVERWGRAWRDRKPFGHRHVSD